MKATTILRKISQEPDLANYFGILTVSDNNDAADFVEKMFGKGSLTGQKPENCEYAYIFSKGNKAPISCPDFVIKADEGGYFFGYILDWVHLHIEKPNKAIKKVLGRGKKLWKH